MPARDGDQDRHARTLNYLLVLTFNALVGGTRFRIPLTGGEQALSARTLELLLKPLLKALPGRNSMSCVFKRCSTRRSSWYVLLPPRALSSSAF